MKVRRLEGNLRRFAKESGAIIILKGHTDYVFDYNGEVKLNKTGNPGMAKGGTGDILSGLAGAFITKNDPLLAAQAAIFINGLAGDLAYEEFGYNFSATDIVPFAQRGVKMCFDMDIKNNP
jgi:NAD(P)H-hydrate epimerase